MAPNYTGTRGLTFFTDYEDQSEDEALEIPEDLSPESVDDEALATLTTQATEAFNALYQDGEADLSEDDLNALNALTEGIEALAAESARREAVAQERRDSAAALAARINPTTDEADPEDGEGDGEEDADGEDGEGDESAAEEDAAEDTGVTAEADDTEVPDALAASARRRETRINLAGLRSRQTAPRSGRQAPAEPTIRDVAFASTEGGGFGVGAGLDFVDMGTVVDRRLGTFNPKQFENAARAGRKLRQQFGIATIQKPHGDLMISDPGNINEVQQILDRATDQSRLPGQSLVASGGWCAPSETLYDIYDCGEVADGLLSIPTVGIARGGIRFNRGVDFSTLLTQTGFHYTEEEDIVGDYDGEGGGSKPCFHIDCVDFVDARLDLDGLCLTAGLLQARGYPEVIADAIRKALIAHEIRMDSRVISELVADSTAVSLPADQVGAAAPILTAVELQAQHYRSSGSLADTTVLEGVFPQWARGVIRSDLSRRLGVDLLDVSNARIDAWLAQRGIAAQFVANWQSIASTAASGFTQWPTEVDFLLYKAGTWIKGTSDVITLDTVYDSTLLGTNDYTALFTEEGILTARRGCDSRVVTVPICPTGDTGGGVAIDCDGSAGA